MNVICGILFSKQGENRGQNQGNQQQYVISRGGIVVYRAGMNVYSEDGGV